jgi:dipeptidyl-peptidase-3
LQVANHELLGHGSGKLFMEDADGKLNFNLEKVSQFSRELISEDATYYVAFFLQTINPLTGKPVTSWYKPGQTPGSVLGTCSSSLEECRAESVAMYRASL